jgi:DNA-binding response OmpR family regulator
VTTRLHLDDLRRAWEARDPELVRLIESLAEQPDEPPETPVGEAPVFLIPERSAVRLGQREVGVTPTQFRLLALLMAEPGRTFSRAELVDRAIGTRVTERTVDVHVKELRRKLGPVGSRIEALRGSGYRFLAAA